MAMSHICKFPDKYMMREVLATSCRLCQRQDGSLPFSCRCSAIVSFRVSSHSSRSGCPRPHDGTDHFRSFRRQILPDRVPAHSKISGDPSGGYALKLGAMDRLPPRSLSSIGFPAQHSDRRRHPVDAVPSRARRGEWRVLVLPSAASAAEVTVLVGSLWRAAV